MDRKAGPSEKALLNWLGGHPVRLSCMQTNEYTRKAVLVRIDSQFNPIPDEFW